MYRCSFGKLVQLLDEELDPDRRFEVLNHLRVCDNCREAVYFIWRGRDQESFVHSRDRLRGKAPASVRVGAHY